MDKVVGTLQLKKDTQLETDKSINKYFELWFNRIISKNKLMKLNLMSYRIISHQCSSSVISISKDRF